MRCSDKSRNTAYWTKLLYLRGYRMNVLGAILWYIVWASFSVFIGMGLAALGINSFIAFLVILLFTGVFFVSTICLYNLLGGRDDL